MQSHLPITEKAIAILRDYVATRHNGNIREAARTLGLDPESGLLHKWLRIGTGKSTARYPGLERLGPVLDKIGAKLVGPDEIFVPGTRGVPDEATMAKLIKMSEELATTRRERDEARGAAAALDRVVDRMAEKRAAGPAQSSDSRQNRTG